MPEPAPNRTTRPDLAVQELPRPKYQLFTDCPQDWFILVVRGGDLYKIIHSVEGWRVDEDFEFVRETPKHKNTVTPLRALTGFEFVGIPGFQGMKVTKFAWNKYWREDGGPTYVVTTHDPELVYVIPFESQYPLTFKGIDTVAQDRSDDKSESFVDVTFVVTVRVRMLRPRVALQTNTDWFGSILIPKMQSALKDFAGNKNYDKLIRKARKEVTTDLKAYIIGEGEKKRSDFRKNILEHAGVDIIDFSLVDIKPNPAFEAAQNRLAEKQKEAQGVIAMAEAKKREKILDGEGQEAYEMAVARGKAVGIQAIRNSAGADSETYIKWSQIQGSKLTTYMEGGSKGSILVGADGRPIS